MSTADATQAIRTHLHMIGAAATTAAEALDNAGGVVALDLPEGTLAGILAELVSLDLGGGAGVLAGIGQRRGSLPAAKGSLRLGGQLDDAVPVGCGICPAFHGLVDVGATTRSQCLRAWWK
jgi:hypothetical protein